mgnify:FL=1
MAAGSGYGGGQALGANVCHGYLRRAIICFALSLLLASCSSDLEPVNGLQFARVWQDSYDDTSITWWYTGEDEEYFYLEEKWPDREVSYIVPKSFIVISGISRTPGRMAPEPVSISRNNLEFM